MAPRSCATSTSSVASYSWAGLLQRPDLRPVGVDGEQAVGDDEDAVAGVVVADPAQVVAHRLDAQVVVADDVPGRRAGPLLQAGVGEPVDEDVVLLADQAGDRAEPGGPAG